MPDEPREEIAMQLSLMGRIVLVLVPLCSVHPTVSS